MGVHDNGHSYGVFPGSTARASYGRPLACSKWIGDQDSFDRVQEQEQTGDAQPLFDQYSVLSIHNLASQDTDGKVGAGKYTKH